MSPDSRPPGAVQEESHASLALEELLRTVGRRPPLAALDLGPAQGPNLNFLRPHVRGLTILDLRQRLVDAGTGTGPARRELLRDLTTLPAGEGFDLVLCWDLLDYLTDEELARLGQALAARCRPRGLLFALVATHGEMPAIPRTFRILDSRTLQYRAHPGGRSPVPQRKEPDLLRLMPGFAVDSTFLLRHGIQEYLLTPRDAAGEAR